MRSGGEARLMTRLRITLCPLCGSASLTYGTHPCPGYFGKQKLFPKSIRDRHEAVLEELRNLTQAKSSHSQNFSSCGSHAIQTVCPSRLTVCCMKRCPQPEQSRWFLACKSAMKSLVPAGPCDLGSTAGSRYSRAVVLETAAALASTFGDFSGDR